MRPPRHPSTATIDSHQVILLRAPPASQRTSIVLLDPVCFNREHAPVNAGFVEAALHLVETATFIGEQGHLAAVRAMLPAELVLRVTWMPVGIPPRSHYALRKRFIPEWRLHRVAARTAKQSGAAAVIVTTATLSNILALKIGLAIARVPLRTAAVMHSALPGFLSSRTQRRVLSMAHPSSLSFVLLGQPIAREVSASLPEAAHAMRAITHPIAMGAMRETSAAATPCDELDAGNMTFAFLGLGSKAKGFPAFVHLAREFASERVHFELIGRIAAECRAIVSADEMSPVHIAGDGIRSLPLPQFRERLLAASYAVVLHDPQAYRFVCSGATLDAIWAAKPLIALRSNGTEELFERMGDIGYLCETMADVRDVIRNVIASPDPSRYSSQSANIVARRHIFGAAAVGEELRQALSLA